MCIHVYILGVVILIMLFKTHKLYLLFSETTTTEKASNYPLRWKTTRTIDPIPRWKGSLPNKDVVYEPIEFVNRFLDDELLGSIVEETNLYSTQKNPNKPLNVTTQKIRNFIDIVYMMSVYKLPATRMYWNKTTRIERIATVMTCNRWEAIKNHLHFNNNDNIPPDNIDKLFKIRPLLSSLLTKFQSTPIDEHLSLDE